ncbi:thiazole biosynthesis protein ThiG [Leptospira inadai serovar Lyme str. 10]|uniref:Thiazole synthase n=2 Tax=Leptospira inadai serovar Lyme TaxID=293084 RepID=V6HIG1_9LEPT|nr:thiazole synthase [Leptospira inadai]EQA36455.1 thiazole biosynthesis protein ThiG [Leptospira inadai serovar Lyme str. 10]PNV76453.1 thiazole synthase [Leptospira inadai serovar Lyme]
MGGDSDELIIAGRSFRSRLFLGTGKFSSARAMKEAILSSETEVVTVALRRVDLESKEDDILANIDREKVLLLPNTSGARNAEEAVRLARLARELGAGNWVKLEVTPDPVYLLPDPIETVKAARILVKEGFIVLPYINADPILCKHLEDAGCATVMPLGSPIGTNQGIRTLANLEIIIEQSKVPVVVDAGLGEPSHASQAMELGAAAVLVNTAIAIAKDPKKIGYAFKLATEAGRISYKYGGAKMRLRKKAEASSPLTGFLEEETRNVHGAF